MVPEGITRVIVYVLGIAVFVGGLLGFDFNLVANAIPDFVNSTWVVVGGVVTGARAVYDLIKEALANRKKAGPFSE